MLGSSRQEIRFSGGDGLSRENAVVIEGARHTVSGVLTEYRWLRRRYPGSQVAGQTLMRHEGRMMDVIDIRTADGELLRIFFDIHDFFGRF